MEKITSLAQLNLNKTYSYADYLTWQLEEFVELIRGKIFRMAAPNRKHQGISWELSGLFYPVFKGQPCKAYAAPFDVRLYDHEKSTKANKDIFTVVQPDICVICDENKLDDKGCLGSPDLIVEILQQQGIAVGDFIYFNEFRGPIKIWEVTYPSNTILNQSYLETDYPDSIRLA